MICPHCSTVVKFDWYSPNLFQETTEIDKYKKLEYASCLNCSELVVVLKKGTIEVYDDFGSEDINELDWEKIIFPKTNNFQESQDIPKVYSLNGSIYLINVKSLLNSDFSDFTKIKKYVLNDFFSIDIDSQFDWVLAENLVGSEFLKI